MLTILQSLESKIERSPITVPSLANDTVHQRIDPILLLVSSYYITRLLDLCGML